MKEFYISPGGAYILKQLNKENHQAYIVGGSVRDNIMGIKPSDYDITTSAQPDEILEVFKDEKTVEIGKKYGTIGVIYKDEMVEVTTFRIDGSYIDGRHPEFVEFSKELEDDLARRDFTINAMAMDLDGRLIDPYGGQKDLKSSTIRSVGDPYKRFEEDKLRMLRAVRFAGRFDFKLEERTQRAIEEMAPLIREVSAERIQEELNKILLSDQPSKSFLLMEETGLLEAIIPELMPTVGYDQMSPYHHRSLFKHMLCVMDTVPAKLHLRLAGLFHDIAKPDTLSIDEEGIGHFYGHEDLGDQVTRTILKRLKYSNKVIKDTCAIIKNHMTADPNMKKKGLKRQIKRLGEDLIFDLYDFMIADMICTREDRDPTFLYQRKEQIKEILEGNEIVDQRGLAIDGKDLIELGMKEGPEIGQALAVLTDLAMEDESINTKDKLLEIIKEKWRIDE